MKLLLDENLSRKLIESLDSVFPDASHVSLLGLQRASDAEIWEYAARGGFTIVTHDSDFNERAILYGPPPKVIWLRTGNVSTEAVATLLLECVGDILLFEKDNARGVLMLQQFQ